MPRAASLSPERPTARTAEEALLDRTLLRVDRPTYNRFLAMLDAPPKANPRLRELLRLKAPWG